MDSWRVCQWGVGGTSSKAEVGIGCFQRWLCTENSSNSKAQAIFLFKILWLCVCACALRTDNMRSTLKFLIVWYSIVTHGVRYCCFPCFTYRKWECDSAIYKSSSYLWWLFCFVLVIFVFLRFAMASGVQLTHFSQQLYLHGPRLVVCLPKVICGHSPCQPRFVLGLSIAVYGNPAGQSTAGSATRSSPAFHGWSCFLQCEEGSTWLKYKS